MTEFEVDFPGGKRVDARLGNHLIRSDQSVEAGGEGTAPAPFDFFLASIGLCAGVYVLEFCEARGISTKGIRLVQRMRSDHTGHLEVVELEILLPPGFPPRYEDAIARAAERCKVKRTLANPPIVSVRATQVRR